MTTKNNEKITAEQILNIAFPKLFPLKTAVSKTEPPKGK